MKKVMVVYHSQQAGNTEACARLVAQGVRQCGDIEVELVNTNLSQRVDMQALATCDGVAIGSPDYYSYVAGTIKQLFDDVYIANGQGVPLKGKPCVLFMTHGGGGAGIKALKNLASSFAVLGQPFSCQGAPEQECREAVQLGVALGKKVLSL